MMKAQFGVHLLELTQGDITQQTVDVVVNAANSALAGGGGVDGAIHRRGGPSLMEETRRRYPLGCPAGDAVATAAGHLPAKAVFHAVGPVWRGGHHGEPGTLRSAYRRCLELVREHAYESIAFPALSTGAYGYPIDLAAEHALHEIRRFLIESPQPPAILVRVVLFDAGAYAAFARVLETLLA
ncbi:MAG TPA: macro domain-containing protein [Planctomycetaceae bacterium]|nr:macro domain-containing protein [Planctomycetaceae bacterium]